MTTVRRMFIFDTALFGELLSIRALLKSPEGADYLLTDDQLCQLKTLPDKVTFQRLRPKFVLGRPSCISDPKLEDGSDLIWEQNGAEYGELKPWYEKAYPESRYPDWERDLLVVEVALNEGAVVVTDRPELQELTRVFDGQSVPSIQVVRH